MTRHHVVVASSAARAVALIAASAWWLFIRDKAPGVAERAGAALGSSVLGALEAAGEIGAPARCARLDPSDVATTLRVDVGTDDVVIGVIADARGASEPTLANLRSIRAELEAQGVDLVITAGGMGTTQQEIAAVLGVLSTGAPWPLVAIPGDREDLEAHRAAIRSLGPNAHDGSRVRVVDMGVIAIGTLPGASDPSHLIGGVAGCVFTSDDVHEILAELSKRTDAARILVSYVPPRQSGSTGSDLAAGGVHVGDIGLGEAVSSADISAAVHAMVDPSRRPDSEGNAPLGEGRASIFLATGAADSIPLHVARTSGAALIIRVGAGRITWRRLLYWFDD